MASGCLLLLLMVSCSFLTCSLTVDIPSKAKITQTDVAEFLQKNLNNIRFGVVPALQLIPIAGPYLGAIINIGLIIANEAVQDRSDREYLMDEFRKLETMLKTFHVDQEWTSWASGAYHKPEVDINTAWREYEILMAIMETTTDKEAINRNAEEFMKFCMNSVMATRTLHELLTPKDISLATSMGPLIAEHAKCHIKEIRQYSVLIQGLFVKGNTLNQMCYKLKNIVSKVRAEEAVMMAYDAARVMFNAEKDCISDSVKYIERDVEELIDDKKNLIQQAKDIREFLDEKYELYDWLVFSFKTKKSKYKRFTNLNKHVFWGFTEVSKGSVSVAVAWQVKGTRTYKDDVNRAVIKCLGTNIMCVDVPDKLKKCAEHLVRGNVRLEQTLTAVHAFKSKGDQSATGEDDGHTGQTLRTVPPEDEGDEEETIFIGSQFYFEGECGRKTNKNGKYFVVIKSDKEIENDACRGVSCGQHGTCKAVKGTVIGVCECEERYYGAKCDGSLDEDLKNWMIAAGIQTGSNIKVIDSRRRPRSS